MTRQGRHGENEREAQTPAENASEPMVNRALELELLNEHVARVAHGGPGHAVLLLGESGVGKSRLSQAAATEARSLEMTVISAQCLGRGAEPLLPIKDGLAAYLGRSQERIKRTLMGAAPRLLDAIPFIGAFLGRIADSIIERRLRGATLEGIYEELARIMIGISEKRGLLLIIEDLHQADQDTLFFINYLLRKIRGHRVLAILTIQEEQLSDAPQLADLVARWTAEGYAVLTVVPLERAHVGEYVRMVATLGSVADEALVDRIAGALTAYACGDALGLPWENSPPSGISQEEIEALPARESWVRGATSDDTALTLLVAQYLAERSGTADARAFLQTLAATAGSIKGLGPSTIGAIEHFQSTGEPPVSGGNTNGAPMRALPVGWVTSLDEPDRRRRLTIELARATHPDPDALSAACVIAACASWTLEGASGELLLNIAIGEEVRARAACAASDRLGVMLAALNAGTWQPPQQGISLDPVETVTAVLACTMRAASLRDGLVQAVKMGGDTDTVAALTGGLLGARMTVPEVLAELPWCATVLLPDAVLVAETASALAAMRSSAD